MTGKTNELLEHWQKVSEIIPPITDDVEYDEQSLLLDELLHIVGEDAQHPLASLLHFIGSQIEEYDNKTVTIPDATPIEVLKSLMQEHGLTQSDLPEIGSQGVVSEILNGKRELNVRQIKALAERFGVDVGIFKITAFKAGDTALETQWQPIETYAVSKHPENVLIFHPDDVLYLYEPDGYRYKRTTNFVVEAWFEKKLQEWQCPLFEVSNGLKPTHWMPMP